MRKNPACKTGFALHGVNSTSSPATACREPSAAETFLPVRQAEIPPSEAAAACFRPIVSGAIIAIATSLSPVGGILRTLLSIWISLIISIPVSIFVGIGAKKDNGGTAVLSDNKACACLLNRGCLADLLFTAGAGHTSADNSQTHQQGNKFLHKLVPPWYIFAMFSSAGPMDGIATGKRDTECLRDTNTRSNRHPASEGAARVSRS